MSSTLRPEEADRISAFSGWRILVLATISTVMTGPGQTIGFSVFKDPMTAALSVTEAEVSTAYMLGTLTGAAAMPFIGRFIDRRGVRLAQTLFGCAFAASLVVMSGANGLIWLTVGLAGIRMFGQGSLSLVSTVSVAIWFERRRGFVMALKTTIAGAGMALVPIALNAVMGASSWRTTWLVAALAVTVIVIPIGWFGLINRPSDVGQVVDGPVVVSEQTVSESGAAVAVDTVRSYTRGEAVRTFQFWVLAAIGVASGMMTTALNFHQFKLMAEADLSRSEAAVMFLPQIVGSSSAAIITGIVLDRIGVRFVPAASMALLVVAQLLAASLDAGFIVVVYAVAVGTIGGSTRAALSTMLPGYFGVDHIGSIQGLVTVANVAGSAVGPVLLALVAAQTGTYRTANMWLTIIPVAIFVFTLFNRRLEGHPSRLSG